jgi:hypothetical protein
VKSLDWKSIKETEKPDRFKEYMDCVGLFLCLTKESDGLSMVYKIDVNLKEGAVDEFTQTIKLTTKDPEV